MRYQMQDIQVGNKIKFVFNSISLTATVQHRFDSSVEIIHCSDPSFDNTLIGLKSITDAKSCNTYTPSKLEKELDNISLETACNNLIHFSQDKAKIEDFIALNKGAIQKYASQNGVVYSDSSKAISLVYTPVIKWQDEELNRIDFFIKEQEEHIKEQKNVLAVIKAERAQRLSELQATAKAICATQDKGINEIWAMFPFIKSLKDAFQVRIQKANINKETSSHQSEFETTYIYKK